MLTWLFLYAAVKTEPLISPDFSTKKLNPETPDMMKDSVFFKADNCFDHLSEAPDSDYKNLSRFLEKSKLNRYIQDVICKKP